MENRARSFAHCAFTAAIISLVAIPAVAAAVGPQLHGERLGRTIVDRVFQRLCDAQEILDGRIPLVDPSRCEPTPPPPPPPPTTAMITVMKFVVNDNEGTATSSDFMIHVHDMSGTTTIDVPGSPQTGSAAGTAYTVAPGQYHIAETGGPSNYSMAVGGDCAADGSIALVAGDNKTCTVTNDDNHPVQTIGHLVISEVYYDVASTTSGSESSNEWMEIYNGSNASVNLQGWYVGDASSTDIISDDITIEPGEWAVVVASTTPAGIPGSVPVIVLNSSIGSSGFANNGDGARLLNPSLIAVDQVGYGTNVTVPPNVAIPGSHDGHALMRTQLTSDTDTAADWADSAVPTPGM
ncbi:lamin tail domain-containing protein [Candidatus Kaiserbacteria bacterium]|nr:lamin tail domain-containing protein [Candidatus Kaiserbacteria bacterium]